MTTIQWQDSYSTGNDRIDREHQLMFEIVSQLRSAMENGESMAVITQRLETLSQHTIAHFAHEEALMQSRRYPGYDRHKQSHDNLIKKLDKLLRNLQTNDQLDLRELTNFLADWLGHHIKGEDWKMIVFFHKQSLYLDPAV